MTKLSAAEPCQAKQGRVEQSKAKNIGGMDVTNKYLAAPGALFDNEEAEVLGTHIAKLIEKAGPISSEDLVNDARPKRSLIHDYFEWDDMVAAELHRRAQAGHILRHIQIVPAPQREPIRAFHVVVTVPDVGEKDEKPGKGTRGYLPFSFIKHDVRLFNQIVDRARREMVGWQKRYRQYEELRPITEGIVQEVIEQLAQPVVV